VTCKNGDYSVITGENSEVTKMGDDVNYMTKYNTLVNTHTHYMKWLPLTSMAG